MILLLSVTHYHNQAEVLEFAKHVNGLALPGGYELHIAVADNSKNWDPDIDGVDNLAVFLPPRNLGYLNGCSFAHKRWCEEKQEHPDWVAVINTDIELSPGFFTRLLGHTFSDKDAVVAPDIRLPSGERQNPHLVHRLSRSKVLNYCRIFGSRVLGRLYFLAHVVRKKKQTLTRNEVSVGGLTTIYAPHGSAIFFRKQYFDAGGCLEYGGFLYCEELHVAEQASLHGLNVVWIPGITLQHNEHSTTSGLNLSRRLDWMYQSYHFILEEYYDRS